VTSIAQRLRVRRRTPQWMRGDAMSFDDLTVEDLMSVALLIGHPRDSAYRARLRMRYADIRHLPVVDDERRLVGIVSDRDLLRRKSRTRPLRLRDVMSRHVRAVQADDPAAVAAQLMIDHRIGALPVIGKDGELIGLVTETDFLRALVRTRHPRADDIDGEPALTYPGLPD
jgi:CBS domain-containing protein